MVAADPEGPGPHPRRTTHPRRVTEPPSAAKSRFGVLTEIDITATLREKLGEQIEDYVVLGACNPPLAHKALTVDRSIGLLLPCNVAIRATEAGTVIEAVDPLIMVELSGNAELKAIAEDAAARLERVLARVAEQSAGQTSVAP